MDDFPAPVDRAAAKALAAERLKERARRVRRIRNRAIAGAAATFVVAWGVVFGQLVSGNDPVIAKSSTTSGTTNTDTSTVNDSTTSTDSSDTYSTGTSSSDTSSSDNSSSPSAVTTSQS
jgi:hypothetical protein